MTTAFVQKWARLPGAPAPRCVRTLVRTESDILQVVGQQDRISLLPEGEGPILHRAGFEPPQQSAVALSLLAQQCSAVAAMCGSGCALP